VIGYGLPDAAALAPAPGLVSVTPEMLSPFCNPFAVNAVAGKLIACPEIFDTLSAVIANEAGVTTRAP
jgi:hypothetical protein